jgi:hypothetical protein
MFISNRKLPVGHQQAVCQQYALGIVRKTAAAVSKPVARIDSVYGIPGYCTGESCRLLEPMSQINERSFLA